MQTNNQLIRSRLLEFACKRGKNKTFCPSEVARSINPENWRALMYSIRKEGNEMIKSNILFCTQKGEPADPMITKGPIRFGLLPK